ARQARDRPGRPGARVHLRGGDDPGGHGERRLHRAGQVAPPRQERIDMNPAPRSGWVEAITGSMFSGKSEELIRRVRRAQIARQKVQLFKPRVDSRYEADHIVSHSEMKMPSQVVGSAREILEQLEPG